MLRRLGSDTTPAARRSLLGAALIGLTVGMTSPAIAQQPAPGSMVDRAPLLLAAASTNTDSTEAEVRRVDKAASKLTLKHGEIKNLDMPPMTMVFGVQDKALLEGLKPGDRVKFKAVEKSGSYTVTELELLK
jgi:Cu(I)/Ag(I) efflux system periplasmic protein CusF